MKIVILYYIVKFWNIEGTCVLMQSPVQSPKTISRRQRYVKEKVWLESHLLNLIVIGNWVEACLGPGNNLYLVVVVENVLIVNPSWSKGY